MRRPFWNGTLFLGMGRTERGELVLSPCIRTEMAIGQWKTRSLDVNMALPKDSGLGDSERGSSSISRPGALLTCGWAYVSGCR